MQDSRKILIDSNLLVLLIVGTVESSFIEKCSKTRAYNVNDFMILQEYLDDYELVITPNIATETNNLLNNGLTGKYKDKAFQLLAAGIMSSWEEVYIESKEAVSHEKYCSLGLTDAGILRHSEEKIEVITDDFDLYGILSSQNMKVVNFTHLRDLGL